MLSGTDPMVSEPRKPFDKVKNRARSGIASGIRWEKHHNPPSFLDQIAGREAEKRGSRKTYHNLE
jgi:hypothetical protein